MTEFVTARFPEAEMPKTQDAKEMKRRLRAFLDGPGRLREAGGQFGPWRAKKDLIGQVERRTSRMGVGPKLIVQRQSDMEQLSIREVELAPSIPDLGAAPEIEKIHAAVWAEFDVRSGGLWLCRFIDGTHSVSKHGYLDDVPPETWRGAAEDIFVIDGGMEDLKLVAEFIVSGTKAGVLAAATVIVDQIIWTPAAGWHLYTGDRHFHVHVDCLGGHPCTPG
jgi:hypothetical protein